jgi:hypothetical protein
MPRILPPPRQPLGCDLLAGWRLALDIRVRLGQGGIVDRACTLSDTPRLYYMQITEWQRSNYGYG